MSNAAWQCPAQRTLAATVTVGDSGAPATERLLLVWHAGHTPTALTLPPGRWWPILDSARAWAATHPDTSPVAALQGQLNLIEPGMHVLTQPLHGIAQTQPQPGP
jgi:glycogen operon protein